MDITITPSGMQALEKDYMTCFGVSSALLMEHAAQGVCAALMRRCPGGRALFLCGTGSNGGDGYAAARLWQAAGADQRADLGGAGAPGAVRLSGGAGRGVRNDCCCR